MSALVWAALRWARSVNIEGGETGVEFGCATAAATAFIWLGMVIAISFIEAPLKFRAPGITLQLGLGIGRLVFRVLNTVEVGMALVISTSVVLSDAHRSAVAACLVAVCALLVQLVVVRPMLTRRSDEVLAAENPALLPRSRAHLGYVACELVKVPALFVGGVLLMCD